MEWPGRSCTASAPSASFLADTPGTIGHARDDLRPGVRTVTVPPHIIYFRYAAGGIEVVRILHEAQDEQAGFAY